ncbi:hypothetical protein Fmac_026657 [Flemingia macrophylla]|uniref:Uncharacterized protein n=1 Tax=Flemingia macrophylla TaxID=520843 RepID=A0ABD1LG23_9FABA
MLWRPSAKGGAPTPIFPQMSFAPTTKTPVLMKMLCSGAKGWRAIAASRKLRGTFRDTSEMIFEGLLLVLIHLEPHASEASCIWSFLASGNPDTMRLTPHMSEASLRRRCCNQYVGQRLHFGKRASERAKNFDEKHQLSSEATTKVVSLNQKVGLSEKISVGTVLHHASEASCVWSFLASGNPNTMRLKPHASEAFLRASERAKTFDEKHQLSSKVTTKVFSLNQKVGFSEKLSAGTVLVNSKVKEINGYERDLGLSPKLIGEVSMSYWTVCDMLGGDSRRLSGGRRVASDWKSSIMEFMIETKCVKNVLLDGGTVRFYSNPEG